MRARLAKASGGDTHVEIFLQGSLDEPAKFGVAQGAPPVGCRDFISISVAGLCGWIGAGSLLQLAKGLWHFDLWPFVVRPNAATDEEERNHAINKAIKPQRHDERRDSYLCVHRVSAV